METLFSLIGRFMDTRFEVHHIRSILVGYIFTDRISKYMQIIQTVTVKLNRKFLRLVNGEQEKVSVYLRLNTFRQRTYDSRPDFSIILLHKHFHFSGEIELHHCYIGPGVQIYLYIIFIKVYPVFFTHLPHSYRIVIIMTGIIDTLGHRICYDFRF